VRRVLAVAFVLDGEIRGEAVQACGMDRRHALTYTPEAKTGRTSGEQRTPASDHIQVQLKRPLLDVKWRASKFPRFA